MITEINRDQEIEMLRSAFLTVNNRCFQQYPKLLLQRIKNQQNVLRMATSAESEDDDNENPQNLPHLPVPDLQETLAKYLRTAKPFLTNDEYDATKEKVKNFASICSTGKNLQDYLLRRAETRANWLSKWWLDTAYLGYRDPVTIFSSPGQSLPLTRFENEDERLDYTAKLIMAVVSFNELVDKKKFPIDRLGKMELDMKQYEKIMGTCRIPACPKDKLEFHPGSKHIIIASNNHFFKLTAITDEGYPVSKKRLINQLKCCITHSLVPGSGIGILTSENRDTWANVYDELMEDSTNKKSVREIQKSLFLVCLDKPSKAIADNRLTMAMKQFIHGGSSQLNSGNRWFDKTLQFILSPSGEVGLTYEHSPSEGQPVAVMVDFVHNYIIKDLDDDVPESDKCSDPIRLEFNLNDKLIKAMETAGKNLNKIACNLDITCFKYEGYGKEFVKSQRLSPDSYIQMAIQSAFYKIHKTPGAHYESASTRMFIGGRTETIRSCSSESIAFAKVLLDKDRETDQKVGALKKAIANHKEYTMGAIKGFGVDRHMLGLRLAAEKLKIKSPEIFDDVGWKRSSYMRLSTSQVATKCDGLMGYAPLVKEGYGCCYNPRSDEINFAISSFEDYPDTSAIKFKTSLEWCLNEMQKILLKAEKSKI